MPDVLINLPDVTETVTQRVVRHVTEQLAEVMGLPKWTQVYIPGYTETVPMDGGTFNKCWNPKFAFPNQDRVVVSFTEEVDDTRTLTTPVNRNEHLPVFTDPIRDITVTPVYRYVTMNVEIQYISQNQTMARRFVDEQRSRISMGRAELYLNLEYHYTLPDAVHFLLMHLYEQMQQQAPPPQIDFRTYFDDYTQVPSTVVETLASTAQRFAYLEHQYEVLGWFDFHNTPPEPQRQGESGAWSTTINFQLHYNRPMQLYCRYPILVHNQLIDPMFRPEKPYQTFAQVLRRVSQTKGSFDALRDQLDYQGLPHVQLPEIDDWYHWDNMPNMLSFLTTLCAITPDDPQTLLNLRELGDYEIDPSILEYMAHQGNRLFGRQGSVFEIVLFENRERSSVPLRMKGLTIYASAPLDVQKYYHLQFRLRSNWATLPTGEVNCLRRYPMAMYTLLKALGVLLGDGDYDDLRLLGKGGPRPISKDCPGAGGGFENEEGEWEYVIPDNSGPGGVPNDEGVIRNDDSRDGVNRTDDRTDNIMKRRAVGPLTVMLSGIITAKTNQEQ